MALSLDRIAHGQVPPSYNVSLAVLAFESINAAKIAAILRSVKILAQTEHCEISAAIPPYR
jgi:hypothetical protein